MKKHVTKKLYLINDGTFTKIGHSSNTIKRIRDLQVSNARKLTLLFSYKIIGARCVEKFLHKYFELKNTRGEWFSLTDNDIELIKSFVIKKNDDGDENELSNNIEIFLNDKYPAITKEKLFNYENNFIDLVKYQKKDIKQLKIEHKKNVVIVKKKTKDDQSEINNIIKNEKFNNDNDVYDANIKYNKNSNDGIVSNREKSAHIRSIFKLSYDEKIEDDHLTLFNNGDIDYQVKKMNFLLDKNKCISADDYQRTHNLNASKSKDNTSEHQLFIDTMNFVGIDVLFKSDTFNPNTEHETFKSNNDKFKLNLIKNRDQINQFLINNQTSINMMFKNVKNYPLLNDKVITRHTKIYQLIDPIFKYFYIPIIKKRAKCTVNYVRKNTYSYSQNDCLIELFNKILMNDYKISELFVYDLIDNVLELYEENKITIDESDNYFVNLIRYVLTKDDIIYSMKSLNKCLSQNDISPYTNIDENFLTKKQFLLYLCHKSNNCIEIINNLFIKFK